MVYEGSEVGGEGGRGGVTRLSVNMFCLETLQLQTTTRRKGGGAEKQLPTKQRNFREISHKNLVLFPECFTNFSSNLQCCGIFSGTEVENSQNSMQYIGYCVVLARKNALSMKKHKRITIVETLKKREWEGMELSGMEDGGFRGHN
jgi:hypothetical protein